MRFREYRQLVCSDLYRVDAQTGLRAWLREMLVGEGFVYLFWLRTCGWLQSGALTRITLYPFARLLLRRYKFRLGISIPLSTRLGPGFYIGHFGGIMVNGAAVIGRNCNLSHGVTIGQANRGARTGCPVIGDNVFIGPGAMIFGAVRIGNNVAIGANSVVTKDVPDHAVVAGSPAQVVSHEGSKGYVNRTDYPWAQVA